MSGATNRLRRLLGAVGFRAAATSLPADPSDRDLNRALSEALAEADSGFGYIEAVYDDRVVYSRQPTALGMGGTPHTMEMRQQSYKRTESGIELLGDPIEVEMVVKYAPAGADTPDPAPTHGDQLAAMRAAKETSSASCGCGSKSGDSRTAPTGERSMSKIHSLVDRLIACPRSPFEATDRANLEAFGETRLTELADKLGEEPEPKPDDETAPPPEGETEEEKKKREEAAFLAKAPAGLRAAVDAFLAAEKHELETLVKGLSAKSTLFTAEQLASKPINELRGMAQLAGLEVGEPVQFVGRSANFAAASAGSFEPPDSYGMNKGAN